MDKLKMQSVDNVQMNIEKIRKLFPNAVTEVKRNGKVTLAVDFDVLKQELSSELIDDKEERYQMTWPDKKKSILLANTPVNKTLRPCREESVDFDNTQNLYIEGDNLDVLKLLQETYLGKIKMIYIDPPYNTGNDFVYNDDFAMDSAEYVDKSGQYDEQGDRLVQNTESNGRFHTDWLNMIYPRLKVAKDLLSDDGVIFISIGEQELNTLITCCDDMFSSHNRIALFNRVTKKSSNNGNNFSPCVDYVVLYAKNSEFVPEYIVPMPDEIVARYNKKDEYYNERGPYQEVGLFMSALKHGGSNYPIECPDGSWIYPPNGQPWRWNEKTFLQGEKEGRIVFKKSNGSPLLDTKTNKRGEWNIYTKVYLNERAERGMHPKNFSDEYQNTIATNELRKLGIPFDFAKPVELIKFFASLQTTNSDIILDFFSGSATTAHAVMQLNAEDGGKRKFIMVQLPEKCDEKSEAYKAGYKTICDIGKERIRRAGTLIKKHLEEVGYQSKRIGMGMFTPPDNIDEINKKMAQDLDVGFRVLKLESSNMKDVYYKPSDYSQNLLDSFENNIKEDRTPLDLLFQVMLDLGKPLSAKIEEKEIAGKQVFIVDDNDLIACFDKYVTEETVTAIAKLKPLYAVLRDSGLSSDSVGANFDQIFATYSPNTTRKVL